MTDSTISRQFPFLLSISFFWFLCLRPSTRWSRRYYVFGWSVCLCVRAYVHTSLTKQQTTSLEYIQRRALQIIAGNIPCKEACCLFKLTSLAEIRDSLCSKLFRQLVSQSRILHCLLPAQRDDGLTGWLRSSNKYITVRARTNRFKNSFVPYAIANYQ